MESEWLEYINGTKNRFFRNNTLIFFVHNFIHALRTIICVLVGFIACFIFIFILLELKLIYRIQNFKALVMGVQ